MKFEKQVQIGQLAEPWYTNINKKTLTVDHFIFYGYYIG